MLTEIPDAPLRRLISAIANGNDAVALRLIEHAPGLACEALAAGATRASAAPHFIEAIGHHVYAGDTALHVASAAYRVAIARALVDAGASVDARNRRGAQPLHYAADGAPGTARWNPQAQTAIIELLAGAGASLNAVNIGGVAPLHRAVRMRCTPAAQSLLVLGADVRIRNGTGSTPLHLAVQNTGRADSGSLAAKEEQAHLIPLLLKHGARLSDTDAQGRTVYDAITSDWQAPCTGISLTVLCVLRMVHLELRQLQIVAARIDPSEAQPDVQGVAGFPPRAREAGDGYAGEHQRAVLTCSRTSLLDWT